MAKATIIIEDGKDPSRYTISVKFNPPLRKKGELTRAQKLGFDFAELLGAEVSCWKGKPLRKPPRPRSGRIAGLADAVRRGNADAGTRRRGNAETNRGETNKGEGDEES